MVDFKTNTGQYYRRDLRPQTQPDNRFYDDNFGEANPFQALNNPALSGFVSRTAVGLTNGLVQGLVPGIAGQVLGGVAGQVAGAALNSLLPGVQNKGFIGGRGTPSQERLKNNGLSVGGEYQDPEFYGLNIDENMTAAGRDGRVTITDPTRMFIGGITGPLSEVGGIMFPYTPTISVSHRANYDSQSLTHSNYAQPSYTHSVIEDISISGIFTANNAQEASYVRAVMHFLKSVTKMFYGSGPNIGTPPPVLFLDAHGPSNFNHIPVVVTSADIPYPDNVDYIAATPFGSNIDMIPTEIRIQVTLKPMYSRTKISNGFDLSKFAKGSLLVNGGPGESGPGGFI